MVTGQLLLPCALALVGLLPPLLMWVLGLPGGLQGGGNTAQPGPYLAGSAAHCPGVSGRVGRLGAAIWRKQIFWQAKGGISTGSSLELMCILT